MITIEAVPRTPASRRSLVVRAARAAVVATLMAPAAAAGQHDYYNTDTGRPLQTRDAIAVEYRGFELLPASVRMERTSGGVYSWNAEPELAYGLFPRTQVGIGVPLMMLETAGGGGARFGVGGVHLSALYQLNVESPTLPAFAVAAAALLPAGEFAPNDAYATLTGIATRTFPWGRLHLNGAHTLGPDPEAGSGWHADISRWSAGISADRAFALRAFLTGVELVADQPLHDAASVRWTIGTGVRYQLDVYWVLDAGLAHRFSGDPGSWQFTLGAARTFGIPRFRY